MSNANDVNGTVQLTAATKVEFDGDTTEYTANNATPAQLKAHADAVANAKDIREGLVRMFSSLLGIK